MFKSNKYLSLKKDKFILVEYIEKRPHLLSNFGMASKLRRFYKGQRPSLADYPRHIGNLGLCVYLDASENIHLIGQLQENQAITIFENNMYKVPVFYHEPKATDFILVRKGTRKGRYKCYLRKVKYLYTAA